MPKRPNMKKQLKKRTEQSYRTKDSGNRINILKLPDSAEFLEIKDKKRYKVDILPFEIVTDHYPDPEIEKGDWHYKLDLWVHRFVGAGEGNYVCLAKNYNKPCPICEELEALKKSDDADDETLKSLKAKRRVVYNMYDYDDEKVKLFETSHFLFEKELLDEAFSAGDGEIITFSDVDEGHSVKFRTSEESVGAQKFIKFKAFNFIVREEPIDDEILEQAINLDEILIIPIYEEMKNAFHGVDCDEDEDEKPKKSKKKVEKDEESDDDEDNDEPKKKKRTIKKTKK